MIVHTEIQILWNTEWLTFKQIQQVTKKQTVKPVLKLKINTY